MLGERGMDGTRAPKLQNFRARTSPLSLGRGHVRPRGLCSSQKKMDSEGVALKEPSMGCLGRVRWLVSPAFSLGFGGGRDEAGKGERM